MKVTVTFLGTFELLPIFEREKVYPVDFFGNTMKDLLNHLFLKIGPRRDGVFFNERGEIFPDLLVLVNGRLISGSNRIGQSLKENDIVELVLASGG